MTFFNRIGWRPKVSDEVDEELEFHIDREARKLEATGLSPTDALRQARLAFGGMERITAGDSAEYFAVESAQDRA